MYKAIIGKITCYNHSDPKYTQIHCGNIKGYTVIVGKESTKTGDYGIFFPPDGQLNKDFALFNNLYRKHPDNGEVMGGYMDENARVKAEKFGGVKSEGLFLPLSAIHSYLENVGNDYSLKVKLEDGLEIDSFIIDGKEIPICNKYYTEATKKAMAKNKTNIKKEQLKDQKKFVFPQHYDTPKLKENLHRIIPGSLVILTEKIHGTSARNANVEVKTEHYKTWQKMVHKFGLQKYISSARTPHVKSEYQTLIGSRRVVFTSKLDNPYYDSNDFRYNVVAPFIDNIHKGEIVYGEIVGFTDTGKSIMQSQSTSAVKDKEFVKTWGKTMNYNYGCLPGTCKFYVYRITNLNPDGVETDLSWMQVKKRAKELGMETVPELDVFTWSLDLTVDENSDILMGMINAHVDGPSTLDKTHIREGVCVRVENENGTSVFKHKSWFFGVLEGFIKDNADYVDMEEVG